MSPPPHNLLRAREWLAGPIARGSALSFAIRFSAMGLYLVQAVLLARLLGPEGYGLVAVTLSAVETAAFAAVLGYGVYGVREIAARTARGEAHVLRAFVLQTSATVLVAGAVLASVLWLLADLFSSARLLVWALPLVPLLALIQLLRAISQGTGKVGLAQLPGDIVRPLLVCGAFGAALLAGIALTPRESLALISAATLVVAIIALWLLRRALPGKSPLGPWQRSWLYETLPYVPSTLFSVLQASLATLMLGWLASHAEAGIYQPVARFAPLVMLPVQAAAVVFMPRVAAHWERGETAEIARLTAVFTRTTTIITGAAALVLALFGPVFLRLFGPEFVEAAPLLWLVGAAQVAVAACGPLILLLSMAGRPRRVAVGYAVALLTEFALGLWLIPAHGALGAAIGMSVGAIVLRLVLINSVRQTFGFNPSWASRGLSR